MQEEQENRTEMREGEEEGRGAFGYKTYAVIYYTIQPYTINSVGPGPTKNVSLQLPNKRISHK